MKTMKENPRVDVLLWAISRWTAEVARRPLQNENRRALDDAWRQVVRFCGGDDVALLGPPHDELIDTPEGRTALADKAERERAYHQGEA